MNDDLATQRLTRRALLTGAGGLAASAAVGRLGGRSSAPSAPPRLQRMAPAALGSAVATRELHLCGTDGWVSMPAGAPADAPFYPDSLAPAPYDTYVFGFRDATGMAAADIGSLKGHAQISAPMLSFDQETDIKVTLSNLGLQQRPDLTDGHTLHWHGFQNAIPLFDGVPELSMSIPIGREFTYFYRPHDPGTYMYHCHFEDVEHVQMGMTGMLFVRPIQNAGSGSVPPGQYVYNDGDGHTGYDREFGFMLTELWSAAHYRDAHIQVSDWTDYHPSFWLLNGRGYPDTIAPNGNPRSTDTGTDRLHYQPISSLVTANSGDRVLLRLANLGYENHAMTLDGIQLRVVGKDSTLLKDPYTTGTVDLGPGESRDVIFTAPDVGSTTTFLLYDRNYSFASNGGGKGYGGQMTEVRISPPGTVPAQTAPNS